MKLPSSTMRLSEILISLSTSLDLNGVLILSHCRKVAYISLMIARHLDLNKEEINKIILAALIHDIGVYKSEAKIEAQNKFILEQSFIDKHCRRGYELTKRVDCINDLAEIILTHHHKWGGGNQDSLSGEKIPLAGRIIHLADRIEALIDDQKYILFQTENILKKINNIAGIIFDPYLVKEFTDLAKKECFWLDLSNGYYNQIISEWGEETKSRITLDDLEQIASTFSRIIDRKSPFTSRHSTGVTQKAVMIASKMGFSAQEERAIKIAGLVHDLGKQAIPVGILHKNDRLNQNEFKIIKQHTYFTYKILNMIKGMGSIPEWAAFHHEKLDGSGYPFHLKGKFLSQGSRIMAVSDIFQALTEDRPYREAFSVNKALEIVKNLSLEGKLDKEVVSVLETSL